MTGDSSGVVDLAVENLKVTGGNYTGGVIGYSNYGAAIKEIKLSGKNEVSGTFLVGGIVGAAHCDVKPRQALSMQRQESRVQALSSAARKTATSKTAPPPAA